MTSHRKRAIAREPDVRLCEFARAGDVDALEALLKRHEAALRRFLRWRLPRKYGALLSEDDLMQETYAEAFLFIGRIEPHRSFESWLRQVALNNLRDALRGINAMRRGGTGRNVEPKRGSESALVLVDALADTATTPSQAAARGEVSGVVAHAIGRLPNAYGEVVRLYDLECVPVEQVARRLGCSVGAVYMRRARALAMLRNLLRVNSLIA